MDVKKYKKYDVKHWQNISAYMKRASKAYLAFLDIMARVYAQIPQDVPFDLNLYPGLKKQMEAELQKLAKALNTNIINGVNNEWVLANVKNDDLLKSLLKGRELPTALQVNWMGRNLEALEAFKKAKKGGESISERVWQTVKIQGKDIERHMALGIKEGKSAAELASEMKQYLNNPDKLFRRVRDLSGELKLSKPAADYNPGRGRYRSSYKNALRLTRSEINRSYQQADNERWKKADYVIGVRVQRSGVPYDCEICDAGAGDYPKDYEWTIWHANCMCFATPILAGEDDIIKYAAAYAKGQEYKLPNQITKFPEKMENFINDTGFKHYGH